MNKLLRSDITFLRFVAVMAVVINHISPKYLVGGYLGVDVFFVLSGFLISSLLIKEYNSSHTINLLKFYNRRVLRIAPALGAVVIFVLVAYSLTTYFTTIKNVALSSSFGLLGLANIYFNNFRKIDYFNFNTNLESLMHLWSLGVEEQFYFLFPVVVLLLFKFKKGFVALLITLFIASLLLAFFITNRKFVYYSLATRSFELIAGVLASSFLGSHYKDYINKLSNYFIISISVICMALITISFYFIDKQYSLPNFYSLLVVIPTSILLIVGSTANYGFLEKLYSFVPFKLLGLASYSIYLWHWAFLALARNLFGSSLDKTGNTIMLVLSVVVGVLSYYFIEQKTRYLKWGFQKSFLVFVLLPLMLSQTVYHTAVYMENKWSAYKPEFFSTQLLQKNHTLYSSEFNEQTYKNIAIVNEWSKKSNILLVGNSYAMHSTALLKQIANYYNFSFDSRPTSGLNFFYKKTIDKSLQHFNVDFMLSSDFDKYDVIIIANSWPLNHKEIVATLDYLASKNKTVVIIGNNIHLKAIDFNNIINPYALFNFNKEYKSNPYKQVNTKLKELVSKYKNMYYIDFNQFLLDNKGNIIYKDGRNSLFYDRRHLSVYGGTYVGQKYLQSSQLATDQFWLTVKDMYKEY